MPINCATDIHRVSQDEFHQIDKCALGIAYDVHNEFGRLFDEAVYKDEIADRCRKIGLRVEREMKVLVTHETFLKSYYIDLFLNHSTVLEAKVREELVDANTAQTLNYLFITDTPHGSLINLGEPSVRRQFVSTSLTLKQRRNIKVITSHWKSLTPEFDLLHDRMIALLDDWGAFLELNLYKEAIVHFLGGKQAVRKSIPIHIGAKRVGDQLTWLLNEDFAFAISARADGSNLHEHQRRFLRHTKLSGMAWINLSGNRIEFSTILNDSLNAPL